MIENFYVYIYLDPRKPGNYEYNNFKFSYEPFYVGRGKNNRWRPRDHRSTESPYLLNKLKKIGHDNIFVCFYNKYFNNLEDSKIKEKELIKSIGRNKKGPLCNLTDGGEGIVGYKFSEASKKKMSEAKKGRKLSQEHKDKISKALKGQTWTKSKPVWNKGLKNTYKHSEEARKKISIASKGRIPWNKGLKSD